MPVTVRRVLYEFVKIEVLRRIDPWQEKCSCKLIRVDSSSSCGRRNFFLIRVHKVLESRIVINVNSGAPVRSGGVYNSCKVTRFPEEKPRARFVSPTWGHAYPSTGSGTNCRGGRILKIKN